MVSKFVASSSAISLTLLAFYGQILSTETDLDESLTWQQFGKERIRATYGYVASGLFLTAGSAISIARNPALMKIASKNSIFVSF